MRACVVETGFDGRLGLDDGENFRKGGQTVRRKRVWISAVIALVMIAAACGDDKESGSSNTTVPGATTPATTTKQPVAGGTITFGTFSETRVSTPSCPRVTASPATSK
jgi:hypothetical protein